MKNTKYFSHDSNALNDPKILSMMSCYGFEGYGWFWAIVETIREHDDFKLDISSKNFFNGLAYKLRTNVDLAKQFINDCVNEFDLFESDGIYIWSNSLNERMNQMNKHSKLASEKAKKRWELNSKKQNEFSNEKINDDYEFSNEKTVGKTPQRKGNMKGKEIEKKLEEKEIVYSDMVNDLTVLLCNKLRENNEKAKLPSDLKKWNSAIDALNRLDAYSFEQIESVLIWSQQNHFWKTNILSATKLREKFAQLLLNMQEEERKATDNAQYKGYGKRFVRTNSNDSKHDNDEGYASDLGGFTVEDAIKLVQARGY